MGIYVSASSTKRVVNISLAYLEAIFRNYTISLRIPFGSLCEWNAIPIVQELVLIGRVMEL